MNLPRDWTVEDVARLPEDLIYELIDGELISLPPATVFHQILRMEVVRALGVEAPKGFLVSYAQSVLVDRINEPRPDIVILRKKGADRTPVLAADVLLVSEVISADSSVRDRQDKIELYARAGIPAYWIFDPLAERFAFTEWLLSNSGSYRQNVQTGGLITIDRPWKTTLDLPGWTRERDRLREAARPNG